MNYTVVWKNPAKSRLAEIWLTALDRAAVTVAADQIDKLLGQTPLDEGESREGEFRVTFERPLAVRFSVSNADRVVSIAEVWTI